MLVLVCGLPGAGKTTLSTWVAEQLGATVLSTDVVEAALHAGGLAHVPQTSDAVVAVLHALAEQHLSLGQTVVVDSVLPDEGTRTPWRELAQRLDVPLAVLEVVCSDQTLHQQHYLSRRPVVPYHSHDWAHVERVEATYQPWQDHRLVLDAVHSVIENGPKALAYLARTGGLVAFP
jgi:predicted kinase